MKLDHQRRGRWSQTATIRFARFDAFKYAEPRCAATSSPPSRTNSRSPTTDSTTIDLRRRDVVRVVKAFAAALAVVIVLGDIVAAVLAGLRDGPWRHNFTTPADQFSVTGMLPAALLTALVSLASKPFQVERKSERPDSDEQLEKLFDKLVDQSGAQRRVRVAGGRDEGPASG
ncbi:hypothetical protein [Nocardia sp. CA-145437]|uniref:hypothetical protein n=1 Tax=Nocardia sp. CA-145437 TaxID=3239980 RepID=UPI003D977AEC